MICFIEDGRCERLGFLLQQNSSQLSTLQLEGLICDSTATIALATPWEAVKLVNLALLLAVVPAQLILATVQHFCSAAYISASVAHLLSRTICISCLLSSTCCPVLAFMHLHALSFICCSMRLLLCFHSSASIAYMLSTIFCLQSCIATVC